jgi:hypothetical protein
MVAADDRNVSSRSGMARILFKLHREKAKADSQAELGAFSFVVEPSDTYASGIISISTAELQHVPIEPNEPCAFRFRRLGPRLQRGTAARKTSLGENDRRGEGPKCIYPRSAGLELLWHCWCPFELSP